VQAVPVDQGAKRRSYCLDALARLTSDYYRYFVHKPPFMKAVETLISASSPCSFSIIIFALYLSITECKSSAMEKAFNKPGQS
jgi:purine-cytosine permease-like protein